MSGWIGVDLDGTLAHYDGWVSATHIGPPVPAMVDRVKKWLDKGITVKIFTARVGPQDNIAERLEAKIAIDEWSKEHFGIVLPVTYQKDFGMYELWDDRAVTVEKNTGRIIMHPAGNEATP